MLILDNGPHGSCTVLKWHSCTRRGIKRATKWRSPGTGGLFDAIGTFGELENRISALPTNQDRGDAFEVFAEAYLATQKIVAAEEVWPAFRVH